jgi:4-amino-4-deoxy-L-arabinose transferase-like glycosyltransferase
MSRFVIAAQGLYYLATGVWPLVSLSTFEAVTGPKTDDWLVQTVGVLAAVIGLALLAGARRSAPSAETVVLSVLAALGFAGVDLVFALSGTIGRIYLADAAAQGLILLALLAGLRGRRNHTGNA